MTGQTTKTGAGSGDRETAQLLLFPLCDARGWLTSALLGRPGHKNIAHLYKSNPDSIFFAWMIDLPAAVDPGAAARAILQVTAGAENPCADTDNAAFNQRIIHLLEKVVVDKSFYQAETLQTAIDRVVMESEGDEWST